jgi:hypothetical protein
MNPQKRKSRKSKPIMSTAPIWGGAARKKKGKRYEKAMEESTVHGDGAYDEYVFLYDGGGGNLAHR